MSVTAVAFISTMAISGLALLLAKWRRLGKALAKSRAEVEKYMERTHALQQLNQGECR